MIEELGQAEGEVVKARLDLEEDLDDLRDWINRFVPLQGSFETMARFRQPDRRGGRGRSSFAGEGDTCPRAHGAGLMSASPFPFLLLGLGAGWLVWELAGHRRRSGHRRCCR